MYQNLLQKSIEQFQVHYKTALQVLRRLDLPNNVTHIEIDVP